MVPKVAVAMRRVDSEGDARGGKAVGGTDVVRARIGLGIEDWRSLRMAGDAARLRLDAKDGDAPERLICRRCWLGVLDLNRGWAACLRLRDCMLSWLEVCSSSLSFQAQ